MRFFLTAGHLPEPPSRAILRALPARLLAAPAAIAALLALGACGSAPGDGPAPLEADLTRAPLAATEETPVTCAGQTCYAGQTCVASACEFADCKGYKVPGDYATLQDAVVAIGLTGGTLCLGAHTYVGADVTLTPSAPLVIRGLSAAKTVVQGLAVDYGSGSPDVVVKGVTLTGLTINQSGLGSSGNLSVSVTAGALGPTSINGGSTGLTLNIVLDGLDISGGSSYDAIDLTQGVGTGITNLTVENSYIHDSASGLYFYNAASSPGASAISILNDTFENAGTAIDATFVVAPMTLEIYDDIFVDNTLALDLSGAVSYGYNALYGNTTNYGGTAVDGPGYIKKNPLLNSKTPPGLKPNSPLRGAADAAYATAHDYFGRARGSAPDIGAVQSP